MNYALKRECFIKHFYHFGYFGPLKTFRAKLPHPPSLSLSLSLSLSNNTHTLSNYRTFVSRSLSHTHTLSLSLLLSISLSKTHTLISLSVLSRIQLCFGAYSMFVFVIVLTQAMNKHLSLILGLKGLDFYCTSFNYVSFCEMLGKVFDF